MKKNWTSPTKENSPSGKNIPDRLKVWWLKNFFHRNILLQNFKKAIMNIFK